jgi:hypothetical protein
MPHGKPYFPVFDRRRSKPYTMIRLKPALEERHTGKSDMDNANKAAAFRDYHALIRYTPKQVVAYCLRIFGFDAIAHFL